MDRALSKSGFIAENRDSASRQKAYLVSQIYKPIGFLLLIVMLVCMLSSCATLSEGECITADWFQIGRLDGASGYARARLYDHQKACAAYGIRANDEAYYEGRETGLASYCTPSNGFIEGRSGNQYRNVCPVATEQDFLEEYRKGQAIHKISVEIEGVERDIDRKENQLDDDEMSDEELDDLRESLRRDYLELRYLNRELIQLERFYGSSGAPIY